MTLPTFQEIWSRYLFNDTTPKKGDDLLNESIIISDNNSMSVDNDGHVYATDKRGSDVFINTAEFMADGSPGSLINGANVGVPSL